MKPIILMTTGLEDTRRGMKQLYCYKNYGEAISEAGGTPLIVADEKDLEHLADLADGLYTTGGSDIAASWFDGDAAHCHDVDSWRDEVEIKLVRLFAERKKPILGICRGMQVINVALGGGMVEDIKAKLDIDHGYGTPHEAVAAEGSLFEGWFGSRFTVNSYHHQAIAKHAEGIQVVVFSTDGIDEAYVHESLPIIATQWHPERMTGADRFDQAGPDMKPIFEYFVDLCKK